MEHKHRRLLTPNEIAALGSSLPLWNLSVDGRQLIREFEFSDFQQAFAFMQRVAHAAQTLDHHPDWSNSYNRVVICLTTHSAGSLTELDLALAAEIDRLSE